MSYGRGDLTGSGGFDPNLSYNSYQNGGNPSSEANYTKLTNIISTNIQKISQNVQEIRRMVNQLGSSQDTFDLRDKLHQRQHHTNQISKDTAKYLKDAKSLPSARNAQEQRHRKTQIERLMGDFSDVLNTFQAAQREAATTEKECVARVRAASSATDQKDVLINFQGTMQQQEQQTISHDELQEIEEREGAIRQLEADIMDVNMIFKDLGQMVHEQGDLVDSIEANVETAEENVVQANVQLMQARQHQASARKKKFICFIVLIVLVLVVALIIYFSVKGNN